MIKELFHALNFTKDAFKNRNRELILWITIRTLSMCVSPLVLPFTLKLFFDSFEMEQTRHIFYTCLVVILIVVPIYTLNFIICLYSDVWLTRSMYSWQYDILIKFCSLPNYEREVKYSDGDVSNIINSGAWASIQIWLHLFRMLSPFLSSSILIFFAFRSGVFWIPILGVLSVLMEVVIGKFEYKLRFGINKRIFELNGKKEQLTNLLVHDMEFLSMYGFFDKAYNNYVINRAESLKMKLKLEIITVIVNSFYQIFQNVYSNILALILFPLRISNSITAGEIGSSTATFTNMRQQITSLKNEMVNTPNKIIPLENLKMLLNIQRDGQRAASAKNDSAAISLTNVSVVLQDHRILSNINLKIPVGQKVAIIGRNGSGKSTLLKVIMGLIPAGQGVVRLFGEDNMFTSKDYKRKYVSYSPAKPRLFNSQTGYGNVKMGMDVIDEKLIKKSAEEYSFCHENEGDFLLETTRSLSGGQASRVAITRACTHQASVYIFDEPTSSLDKHTAQQIIIKILQKTSVLFTTHNPDHLEYVDRVILMEEGEIILDGDSRSIKEHPSYLQWLGHNETIYEPMI